MSSLSHPKYQRQRIVKDAQKHSATGTAIRYKVSRKTVYKWISRYDRTLASLEDGRGQPAVYQRKPNSSMKTCLGMKTPNQVVGMYQAVMF